MNKIKIILLILSTVMLLSACEDPEKGKLDSRAMEYWRYKINKDFDKAYEYLSPGWRSTESKETFARRMSLSVVKWLSVKIKEKICSEKDLCVVVFEIVYEYRFKGGVGGEIQVPSEVKETWMMKGNVWYHVPIQSNIKQK